MLAKKPNLLSSGANSRNPDSSSRSGILLHIRKQCAKICNAYVIVNSYLKCMNTNFQEN